jgi:hypothetical protein
VPLRTGFRIEVEAGGFAFFLDMVVDVYFVADVILNFRTAFYKVRRLQRRRAAPRPLLANITGSHWTRRALASPGERDARGPAAAHRGQLLPFLFFI